jgi:hypothetical protein
LDYEQPDKPATLPEELTGSEMVIPGNSSQLLAVDFLRGFNDKGIDPAFAGDLSATEDGAARADGMHVWAYAAATSMDHKLQRANPDGNDAASGVGADSATFWDFEHVYQWEVEENVLDSGCDISQVALSDIYLSPKTNSTTDPQIIVCELNDQDNCRPLSD